jgi:NADH:ubiquinone oxidoreductase subunit 3 (subunit A)
LGDIVILFLIQNILIFCLIFWLLTWAGEFFYKKKNHYTKRNFYECGFKSTSDVNIQINFNFYMICVFLILYDVEFTLLIPVFFNLGFVCFINFILILLFIVLIILSLVYDWQMNALNWQY